jgi:hypothetical protein
MQDYDLPQIAIDELIRLAKEVGTPIEDRPEFQILWDERLIMGGDKKRVHITQRGVSWLHRRGLIPESGKRK